MANSTVNSAVSSVTQIMASQSTGNAANTNRNSASEVANNETPKDFGATLREQQQRHENAQQTKTAEAKPNEESQTANKAAPDTKPSTENVKSQDKSDDASSEKQDASAAVAAQLLQNLQLGGNAQNAKQVLESESENLTGQRQNTPLSSMLAALGKNVRPQHSDSVEDTDLPIQEAKQNLPEGTDFKNLLQTKQADLHTAKEVSSTPATTETQAVVPTLSSQETTPLVNQEAQVKPELETTKALETKVAVEANQAKNLNAEPEHTSDAAAAAPIIDTSSPSATAQALAAQQISTPQAQTQTQTVAPNPTIYSAVGSQKWGDDLGQQMVWMAKGDESKAQIQLTPPHMGPIEVSISLKGDQATATFLVSHAQTKEALEQAIPKLREAFEQAGIQLGQANVQSGTQQHTHAQGQNNQRSGWMKGNDNQNEDKSLVTQGAIRLNKGGSGVDIFA